MAADDPGTGTRQTGRVGRAGAILPAKPASWRHSMIQRTRRWWATALFLPALATGCSSTTLKTVWYDQKYDGGLSKVLVIGVAEEPATRRFFEDDFARQLQARGANAIPSYTILDSPESILDEDAVKERIRKMGVDTVLITRVLDTKTVEHYYPPEREYRVPGSYHRGWHSYYADGYERVTRPGYTVKQQVFTLETNVYETQKEELIYSAITDTVIESSSDDALRSFIGVIVQDLATKGLVGPAEDSTTG